MGAPGPGASLHVSYLYFRACIYVHVNNPIHGIRDNQLFCRGHRKMDRQTIVLARKLCGGYGHVQCDRQVVSYLIVMGLVN